MHTCQPSWFNQNCPDFEFHNLQKLGHSDFLKGKTFSFGNKVGRTFDIFVVRAIIWWTGMHYSHVMYHLKIGLDSSKSYCDSSLTVIIKMKPH